MEHLLRELFAAFDAGRPVISTTLVETRGSTPQKAGAAMLVFADGSQVGTLGGGCVEAEVKRRALERIDGGPAELLTFQLDHDYGWDDGLICGGRMTMLVAPVIDSLSADYYRAYASLVNSGAGCTEVVLIDEERFQQQAGDRFLFDAHGVMVAELSSTDVPQFVLENLRPLSDRPRAYVADGASYLPQLPRCRLIVVGGGHVGEKVAGLAADVDFDVWVTDDRETYCNPGRFPQAQRLIVGPIDESLPQLEIDASTFCIIVTRGHSHDEEALAALAPTPARYVGMIGSKRKIRLIFDDLRAEGLSDETLSRVHAPLGLDIGSQTVPEIAVSIVAELIAIRNRGGPQEQSLSSKNVAIRAEI
ncbi:MAG: XdhC family protein [Planctomycetaceae bacterium]|nr:XdhC family protein [Planctomycetaceae bacterium]